MSTGCPAFLGGFSSNFFKTNGHQVGRPVRHSLRRQYAIEQEGQLFFTATSSPLDDERDNNSRHSDGSQNRHQCQRSISRRGHKASTCFFAWGVEHRQLNRTRPGIGGINPQRVFDRYGHLGLRGRHLFNVQTLSRNRHRTLALKGGVALGCRDFLDGIDTRVHTAQFHMSIRVRGDARVGIRRPRAVSR